MLRIQLPSILAKTVTDESEFGKSHERLGYTMGGMSEKCIKDRQDVIVMPGKGVQKNGAWGRNRVNIIGLTYCFN